MIDDLDLHNKEYNADICIVGGGVAGICLAKALEESGLNILLLEAGGLVYNKKKQALYSGDVVNPEKHPSLDKYRYRQFGGTSSYWGGRCVEYDNTDFSIKSDDGELLWPIGYGEIKKYYNSARQFLDSSLPDGKTFKDLDMEVQHYIKNFSGEFFNDNNFETYSLPTDVSKKYLNSLKKSKNIQIVLNSNLTNIELLEDCSDVRFLNIVNSAGEKSKISAKLFVLAMGGIEIPRMLLASSNQKRAGVANSSGLVGRYYMTHLAGVIGQIREKGDASISYGYGQLENGVYVRRRYKINSDCIDNNKDLNIVVRIHFPDIANYRHKTGILSLLYLGRKLIGYEYGLRMGIRNNTHSLVQHLKNLIIDMPNLFIDIFDIVFRRFLSIRKAPPIRTANSKFYALDFHSEQSPNYNSSIQLSSKKDKFGVFQSKVDWRVNESDIKSIQNSLKKMKLDLENTCDVDINLNEVSDEIFRYGAYGGHHIGTTRMGRSANSSVVDKNLCTHDHKNLYILSSSVFPTSGQANPTLTIAAFAFRLGEHIKNTAPLG
jgi:choline dehydrogenase-like flavoprotein